MASPSRWQVVPGSSFRWRHWDDEHVLYHEESGDTHRLSELGARAIGHLAAPMTPDDLAARLANVPAGEIDPEFASTIHRLLAHLYDLGLVEPVTADDALQPEPVRRR